ncbi:MAG: hypothetical protein KKD39_05965 [Candidatus Altiarchaeota archaeon]|nr:hypothetical protein [Candidatus Altiarchaeota archaeon]
MSKQCPFMGGKECSEVKCMFWTGDTSHRVDGMLVANEPECAIMKAMAKI